MAYRTLEIGPGDQSRHDIGGVELGDEQEYVALDVNPEKFGVFDEVVMLGSQGSPKKKYCSIHFSKT